MDKKIKIWLNYDFGFTGDFENLFILLDKYQAIECGSDLAYFEVDYAKDFVKVLKQEIETKVKLNNADRIFLIVMYKEKIKQGFLFGKQKRSAWEGYAQKQENNLLLEDI